MDKIHIGVEATAHLVVAAEDSRSVYTIAPSSAQVVLHGIGHSARAHSATPSEAASVSHLDTRTHPCCEKRSDFWPPDPR
jgi:hypothetical protein